MRRHDQGVERGGILRVGLGQGEGVLGERITGRHRLDKSRFFLLRGRRLVALHEFSLLLLEFTPQLYELGGGRAGRLFRLARRPVSRGGLHDRLGRNRAGLGLVLRGNERGAGDQDDAFHVRLRSFHR